ncbi:peptide chain release factor 1 [Buchnera aphidicola (Thelaxes californica)]|uniref:Peptide chain release factor 1 n=1 Tax=Buchnera aphidicola (Thelaxes californica) TaxID=1315998 RepID=A0A4D6YLX8_9GAMM|nr:peptide chain release factor 1 [Buchnera aphidicola]QCI26688.1 peptide chain release factor 1 [Buchnera aphidicola (Thelaxes californica)]
MKKSIVIKLEKMFNHYQELEKMLSNKEIILNNTLYKKLSKEYFDLTNIVLIFKKWKKNQQEILGVKTLLQDVDLHQEAKLEYKNLLKKNVNLENKLIQSLIPNDPNDKKSCFIEIRAATGGDESAIFAGELFRMYVRYAEQYSWKVQILNVHEGEKGGYKEIIAKISGNNVMKRLKFESGGHRVQRIPKTETQGRVHTSTCTVAIMPLEKTTNKYENINPNDLKIDTFRSSGAGGQHVNTTDSAIRITHIPTGHVVECQDERSQHKNKARALSILSARINAAEANKKHEKESEIRRNLLGTGERSDRNRTYNFPNNRITDHRINLTVYRLSEILNGNLDILIEPMIKNYQSHGLSSF